MCLPPNAFCVVIFMMKTVFWLENERKSKSKEKSKYHTNKMKRNRMNVYRLRTSCSSTEEDERTLNVVFALWTVYTRPERTMERYIDAIKWRRRRRRLEACGCGCSCVRRSRHIHIRADGHCFFFVSPLSSARNIYMLYYAFVHIRYGKSTHSLFLNSAFNAFRIHTSYTVVRTNMNMYFRRTESRTYNFWVNFFPENQDDSELFVCVDCMPACLLDYIFSNTKVLTRESILSYNTNISHATS